MTKDRALEVLYVYASVNGSGRCTQDEFEEAKKMAIEALSNSEIPNNSDCISRQAAIDWLKSEWDGMATSVFKGIESLPSAQQWIPCSERLPENEDIYLVTFDKSNLLDNETQVSDAYWINNQWQYGVLESYERRMPKLVIEPIEELKVIAWMPSPEPYKGEDE